MTSPIREGDILFGALTEDQDSVRISSGVSSVASSRFPSPTRCESPIHSPRQSESPWILNAKLILLQIESGEPFTLQLPGGVEVRIERVLEQFRPGRINDIYLVKTDEGKKLLKIPNLQMQLGSAQIGEVLKNECKNYILIKEALKSSPAGRIATFYDLDPLVESILPLRITDTWAIANLTHGFHLVEYIEPVHSIKRPQARKDFEETIQWLSLTINIPRLERIENFALDPENKIVLLDLEISEIVAAHPALPVEDDITFVNIPVGESITLNNKNIDYLTLIQSMLSTAQAIDPFTRRPLTDDVMEALANRIGIHPILFTLIWKERELTFLLDSHDLEPARSYVKTRLSKHVLSVRGGPLSHYALRCEAARAFNERFGWNLSEPELCSSPLFFFS